MNQLNIKSKFNAYQTSRILFTAFELEIFTLLDNRPLTSTSIADQINTDVRATDRLLNALCALDFLNKKQDKFSNTEHASKYLVKGKPEFMSGLYHSMHTWESWNNLTTSVRTGLPANELSINERGEFWLESFIESMHHRAQVQAKPSISGLDLSGVSRVLDIGGGSAAFSMAFVDAKQGIKATVFDLPNVTPITWKYIDNEGYSESIDTFSGDYLADDLPSGYDLIFLSAIVHINSDEENRKLIAKCAKSLNPGGQIVVQDFIMENDRTKPAHGTIFALNMLVATSNGDTFTENEVKSWMSDAGLKNHIRIDQVFGTSQIIGSK